jgi:hypothetical protein
MAEFKVHGPFPVKVLKKAGGRCLNADGFWKTSDELKRLSKEVGVYVFGIKASGAKTFFPYYVGQAKKNFEQEVFTPHKLVKFQNALLNFAKGAPALFLVVHPAQLGPKNKKEIVLIEDYFIELGFSINSDIENDKNAKLPPWAISGVVRGKKGKASNAAISFREMFGMSKKQIL